MILLWIIAIFVWMYMIPALLLGLIFCFPIFIFITPVCLLFSLFQYYFQRKNLERIQYKKWFGAIDKVEVNERCLITFHPHGILCIGILLGLHFQPKSTTKFAVSETP